MAFLAKACVAPLLAAAAITACGCGGSTSTADPQFSAKAEVICGRLNLAIEANAPSVLNRDEIIRVTPKNAALEFGAVNELGKLRPPSRISGDWKQTLTLRRELGEQLVKLVRYEQAGNARAIPLLEVPKRQTHLRLLHPATRDGFKRCSRVG
jgi:hypothetical protein